jgi:vacuolar-type H+-ATPase subunit H
VAKEPKLILEAVKYYLTRWMMQNIENSNDLKDTKDPHSSHSEAVGSLKHAKEPGANEKIIQKVLEIEKQADQVLETAVHEAELLPVRAYQDVQAIVEEKRTAAQKEANQVLDSAKEVEQSAKIMAEAEKQVQRLEVLASNNFSQAVAYVIARVIGRE